MTKKELILKYFSEMDINMLELLLDDEKTYQDVDKATFIYNLELLFDDFKSNNDSGLNLERGKCVGDDSEKCGCSGYVLIGNNSKKHTDFVFKESEDDFEDIFNLNPTNIYIEKQKNSISHILKEQKCNDAINELIEMYNGKVLTLSDCSYWLVKYKELSKEFEVPQMFYKAFQEFYDVYFDVKYTIKNLQYDVEAIVALKEFKELDLKKEDVILNWLFKYEKLFENTYFFFFENSCYNESNTDRLEFSFRFKLFIEGERFKNTWLFKKIYSEKYREILDKIEEEIEINHKDPNYEESLMYYWNIWKKVK